MKESLEIIKVMATILGIYIIRFGIFCSELCILFSPLWMLKYILMVVIYSIVATICERKQEQ